jgi:preprotein translocase subunit SecF
MFIINNRKFFFILSAILVVASFFSVWKYGFNLGIDFKGGSVLEVSYASVRPQKDLVSAELEKLGLGNFILTPSSDKNFILKTRELSPVEKTVVMSAFQKDSENVAKEERFSSIGPVVGDQLKNKAMVAIAIVIICILLFVTFAFRKVSNPVASWKYGLVTIVALLHDVVIPTGLFVAYSHFTGAEIDLLFVSAILAILGYSVHDTIVVFDRVRESLKDHAKGTFDVVVGDSLMKTMSRSINTSLTTFITLLSLYFIGGETTKDFAFLLLIGILVGTYSSIFVASPLLVTLEKLQKKD